MPVAPRPQRRPANAAQIARGKYLVDIMGCHDCHTPDEDGTQRARVGHDRALSGHPEEARDAAGAGAAAGPWIATIAATITAFSGPWGTSFTMNLTPDKETGLGDWTVEEFIATMKTGTRARQGPSRAAADAGAEPRAAERRGHPRLFAYLQTLQPIKNRTPQPIEPPEAK